MGNRRAREFVLRRADEAAWERSRTEERPAAAHVEGRGIGHRRVQVIRCPSFEEGTAWEVCEHPDGWRVFRSRVVGGTRPEVRLVGYDPVPADPAAVGAFCDRLAALTVPVSPAGRPAGADGTTYYLAVFDLFCEWRIQWWVEPPPQWAAVAGIAAEMIDLFAAADEGRASHSAT